MRLVKITETDVEYVKGLRDLLIQSGAQVTDVAGVFEVEDDFDISMLHGIEEANSEGQVTEELDWSADNADVVEFLAMYDGNFGFILSLRDFYDKKKYLSEKQVQSLRKCMMRDQEFKAKKETTKQFSINVGEVRIMSKFIASKVASAAGLARPHYAVEVCAVHAETMKAYEVTLRLSGQRTNHCGCCGKHLTDPDSVSAGIGPICASKAGISFGGQSLIELQSKLRETREVKTWVPKVSLKMP